MNNNLKCIFVSNDKYGDGINSLSGANRIIKQIYDFFVNSSFVNEENAILIQNKVHTDAINKIFEFMSNVTAELQEENTLLFYFCGHGFSVGRNFNEVMLATTDTNEVNLGSVGIKFDDILNKINDLGIKRFIAILDCCSSGLANTMGINNISFNDKIENKNKNGTVIITSSKGSASTFEIEIDNNLIPGFSYYFYEAVKSLSQDKTKFSLDDIFTFIQSKIVPATKGKINPQITSQNFISSEYLFHFSNTTNKDVIPMKNSIIDVIDWRITSKCNNNCGICYASNNLCSMEKTSIDVVIQQLNKINCKTICITGGEATLCENFEYIINQLYINGFSIFLSTNGTNFTKFRELYENSLEKLSLPLDGFDKKSNAINGRNEDSFDNVIEILNEYQNKQKRFKIKISTVLTSKNCNKEHFLKMLRLLKQYDISIWKLYEFIPESRGAENKKEYITNSRNIDKIKKEINEVKNNLNFHIELISRQKRNSAYFIIQPDGTVIIPTENVELENVIENKIGNILNEDIETIISKWNREVNEKNYIQNMKLRDIHKPYILNAIEKNVLFHIMSKNEIPSIKYLSQELKQKETTISKVIDNLYKYRIIKNVIPMINLKIYNINTFLVTLYFTRNSLFPKGYYIDYLYYNPHIGWITECENRIIRIALFAKNEQDATSIVRSIKKDLQGELIEFEICLHKLELTLGERNLFTHGNSTLDDFETPKLNNIDTIKNNSNLTYTEFDVLRQLENLRKPLVENLNEKLLLRNSTQDANEILNNLKKRKIIQQLYTVLDTRMLGYKWYIVFVNNQTEEDTDRMTQFLISNFSNITHINNYVTLSSKWDMDFEVHVSSYIEIENMLEILNKEFSDSIIENPLRIKKEHKFSFFTHYVYDEIYKNHIYEGD